MYTGLTGSLEIELPIGGFIKIAYISGWSIQEQTQLAEITKVGSVHKEAYVAYQNWSASSNGAMVFEVIGGHGKLFWAKHNGKKIRLKLAIESDSEKNSNEIYFVGEGYIDSLNIELSTDNVAKISIGIKGSGPLKLFVNDCNIKECDVWDELWSAMEVRGDYLYATKELARILRVDNDGNLVVRQELEEEFRARFGLRDNTNLDANRFSLEGDILWLDLKC